MFHEKLVFTIHENEWSIEKWNRKHENSKSVFFLWKFILKLLKIFTSPKGFRIFIFSFLILTFDQIDPKRVIIIYWNLIFESQFLRRFLEASKILFLRPINMLNAKKGFVESDVRWGEHGQIRSQSIRAPKK